LRSLWDCTTSEPVLTIAINKRKGRQSSARIIQGPLSSQEVDPLKNNDVPASLSGAESAMDAASVFQRSNEGKSSEKNQPVVPANATIGGNRVVQLLGVGGMGQVWLGEDPRLDRPVAIKTMRREYSADADAAARFLREARAVARLNHANIIQIFQAGEEGGILYFVMEYVRGESLGQRLKREGKIEPALAGEIVCQVSLGLAYAAAYGVIHRDVKPANIMLDVSGQSKLTDFGLAKILSTDVHITQTGTAMGSPGYMSPEIAKGEPADHRADIYSLGITFYQMLTGELPFMAPTPVAMMLKHVQEPLPEPPWLKALGQGALLDLLKKMTAKHPAHRFRNYRELVAGMKVVADTGILGPHFHLPSIRSIPEPASPYPTPMLEIFAQGQGEFATNPPSSLPGGPSPSQIVQPAQLSQPIPLETHSPPDSQPGAGQWIPQVFATPSPENMGANLATVPRAEALGEAAMRLEQVLNPDQKSALGYGFRPDPTTGTGSPLTSPQIPSSPGRAAALSTGNKEALVKLARTGKQQSTLLLTSTLAGILGLILLLGYALVVLRQTQRLPTFSSVATETESKNPLAGSSNPQRTPPSFGGSAAEPGRVGGVLERTASGRPQNHEQVRLADLSRRPWVYHVETILTLLERLQVDEAGRYLQDLRQIGSGGLPSESESFILEMDGYTRSLGAFRSEFLQVARRPQHPVVISSPDYGQLTLIGASGNSLLFRNSTNSEIQLLLSTITANELTQLASLLTSGGRAMGGLSDYRRFLGRRLEILSRFDPRTPPGQPATQAIGRTPRENRLPPLLPPSHHGAEKTRNPSL
jgi:serine/threonine protein kinase